jgi:hypothetical protein
MWIYHKDISDIRERNMNYELLWDTEEVTLAEMGMMPVIEARSPHPSGVGVCHTD